MRDLVEAARLVLDTVPMHDETCACQYSPTQPADCCDSSKALASLRAALAAHEARPAVEALKEAHADANAERDGDACCAAEDSQGFVCTRGKQHAGPHMAGTGHSVLAIWELAAETAAGVGR